MLRSDLSEALDLCSDSSLNGTRYYCSETRIACTTQYSQFTLVDFLFCIPSTDKLEVRFLLQVGLFTSLHLADQTNLLEIS